MVVAPFPLGCIYFIIIYGSFKGRDTTHQFSLPSFPFVVGRFLFFSIGLPFFG